MTRPINTSIITVKQRIESQWSILSFVLLNVSSKKHGPTLQKVTA
jgi:hypothetical protein